MGSDVAYYILHEWTTDERRLAFFDARESTTTLEAMASVRCARAFANTCQSLRVLMEGDNEPFTTGMRRCYSRIPAVMDCIHQT